MCLFTLEYDKENVSPWSTVWSGLLAAHYKSLGFPKLGFLSYSANPLHPQYPPGPLNSVPWIWVGKGN